MRASTVRRASDSGHSSSPAIGTGSRGASALRDARIPGFAGDEDLQAMTESACHTGLMAVGLLQLALWSGAAHSSTLASQISSQIAAQWF